MTNLQRIHIHDVGEPPGHIHDGGAVASDGSIIRTLADYEAFLTRMAAKRAQDARGEKQDRAPTLQEMIDDNSRILKAAEEKALANASQALADAVAGSSLGDRSSSAAGANDGPRLHGRSLFKYRLAHPSAGAAADGQEDDSDLDPREIYIRNLRNPRGGDESALSPREIYIRNLRGGAR